MRKGRVWAGENGDLQNKAGVKKGRGGDGERRSGSPLDGVTPIRRMHWKGTGLEGEDRAMGKGKMKWCLPDHGCVKERLTIDWGGKGNWVKKLTKKLTLQ